MSRESLCGRYTRAYAEREGPLYLARDLASYIDPTLMPLNRDTHPQDLVVPDQGFVASCVYELAAKVVLALFPPDVPFFRFDLQFPEGTPKDVQQEIRDFQANSELAVSKWIESSGLRSLINQAIEQAIAVGPAVIDLSLEDVPRIFYLDQFVWEKDVANEVIELITKSEVSLREIQMDYPELLEKQEFKDWLTKSDGNDTVSVYRTIYKEEDGSWESYSEWDLGVEDSDYEVPDSRKTFKVCPFLCFELSNRSGFPYGRPYTFRYYADIQNLNANSRAIQEVTGIFARCLVMVNPAGLTRKQAITTAPNGGTVDGREEDVKPFTFADKIPDFQFLAGVTENTRAQLDRAFLRSQSVQRAGERVTAEEIRTLISDIERALGGAYSELARRVQLPLVRFATNALQESGVLDKQLDEFDVAIVTGLEALSRGAQLQRVQVAMGTLGQTVGLEQALPYIDIPALINLVFNSASLSPEKLVKSPEQIAQDQQAALAAEAAPGAIQAGIDQATQQR